MLTLLYYIYRGERGDVREKQYEIFVQQFLFKKK